MMPIFYYVRYCEVDFCDQPAVAIGEDETLLCFDCAEIDEENGQDVYWFENE